MVARARQETNSQTKGHKEHATKTPSQFHDGVTVKIGQLKTRCDYSTKQRTVNAWQIYSGMLLRACGVGGLFIYAAMRPHRGRARRIPTQTAQPTARPSQTAKPNTCEVYTGIERGTVNLRTCALGLHARWWKYDRRRKPERIECRHLGESHDFYNVTGYINTYLLQRKIKP